MIISMYMAALMMAAFFTLESIMPEWLTWVCTLGPCVCYIIADIRYSQLKKRIKELEESNADNWKTWKCQVKINDNTQECLKKLVIEEDDGK